MKPLTKAEEDIMQIIWQLERCTVSDIRDHIQKETGGEKSPHSTISTIVRILEEKGFLDHKAYGRTYEYFPIVSKADYSRRTLKKFVSDYFEGSMNELVSYLVKEEKIDMEELSKLLQDFENNKTNDHD
ncbi:MAG: BlaI family penicillinase repressor [Saprospiraceae bacterium]|jgi:BlaI family penicillinase repressor